MLLKVHRDLGTAVKAVYERLMQVRVHVHINTHTNRHTALQRAQDGP